MTNVAAAMLRPQLAELPHKIAQFNKHWRLLASRLRQCPHIHIPPRHPLEHFVGSSLQFSLRHWTPPAIERVVDRAQQHGVPMAWFGRDQWLGFTSTARHWAYAGAQQVPNTEAILSTLLDVPLYHTSGWDEEDLETVAAVVCGVIESEGKSRDNT